MAGGGQGYLFLVLSPFARRGILFVSGLFHLQYFPSRLPTKRQHLSHHDQSLISHPVVRSDKRFNQPQCSSSSRPSTNHHTDLSQHDSRTSSSSQPMFGVIELGLGEEWFGVSRSTTAADKATYKRS
ncbi:hypothetical protein D6D17_05732 [Aureobasidium pullulans]|nr:hypothetical protein D6D17_05732 [Aureobasidium pullulans]